MAAIAARAGVTKVTLYKRFPDKRSLLRAVLQERRPQWLPPPPTSADVEERLKYYAAAILARALLPEIRAFHDLAASAWPAPDDMGAREEVLGYHTVLERLEQEIREGGRQLGVASADASAVALALMAMLSGWFDHKAACNGDHDAEAVAFAHKAVELLIHGKGAW